MNQKNKTLIIGGYLSAIVCEILYGLSPVFTKHAANNTGVLALLGWRFLVAFLVMTLCAATGIIKLQLRGKSLKPLFLIALFCPCIYFTGENLGISFTTASESGVFLACIPVTSIIASTLILKKKPTKTQVIGISLTLVGVFFTVFAVGATASFSALGYLLLSIAVISYAFYSVSVEKAVNYSGVEITYVMAGGGAVLFSVMALTEAVIKSDVAELLKLPFQNTGFLIAILYQGIGCSVIAFFLYNIAVARIGVNKTSSFFGLATVVSVLAGTLVLKEQFSSYQIAGAIIIIIGVFIANFQFRRKRADGVKLES